MYSLSAASKMKVHMLMCFLVAYIHRATANHLCSPKERQRFAGNYGIPIRLLALDFDGTATTFESKDLLQFVYEATLQYKHGDKATKEAMAKKWNELIEGKFYNRTTNIVKDTIKKLKTSNNRLTPGKILLMRKTLTVMDNTVQYFLNIKEVQNHFLKGITADGIKEVANKTRLCPGLIGTLKHFPNNPANVLSAGPSKILDESVFHEYNAPQNLIIHAGEFVFKDGVSTGNIIGELTAYRKEKVMTELIREHQNTLGYSIYVGNSFVDILAMLKADIGIAINYTPLFVRFLQAIGIATQSVSEWRGACSNQEYLIYTAQSWYEIEEMMFGHQIET